MKLGEIFQNKNPHLRELKYYPVNRKLPKILENPVHSEKYKGFITTSPAG